MSTFREPVNTLTHLLAAAASVVGLIFLLLRASGDLPKQISLFVYGVCMIVLYLASTLLHGVKTSPQNIMRLNRLDHAAIFLLIAGTYTPIAYNIFPQPWRSGILIFIWSATLLGGAQKLFSRKIHGFYHASIYVILSWGAAVPLFFAVNLVELVPWEGFLLLLAGGLVYTFGFFIYYFEKPDPWPGVLGHHEIWHLFVMTGSLLHFLFMLWIVAPYPRLPQ